MPMDANMTPTAVASFGQGSLEAIIQSQQIWTAGLHDIAKTVAEATQARMSQSIAAFKALAGVKSLPEAMELQSAYARGMLDAMMTESGKLSAASMKLAEESMAPIKARMSLAAETFKPTDG
jgi:phasin family protein